MDTSANTITTMGIISNEVYDDGQVKKYFKDNPENLVANGTTYVVKDRTGDSTLSGFNALLLQDTTKKKRGRS